MKRQTLAILLLGCAGLWSAPAPAVDSCSVSANGVAFGVYDPLTGGDVDSTGTVTVTCTNSALLLPIPEETVDLEIALSAGNSSSFNPRQLDGPSDTLAYNLYTTTARNTVWGNGTMAQSGSLTVPSEPCLVLCESTASKDFTVYGRLFGGQNVPAGTYSDMITVTVMY